MKTLLDARIKEVFGFLRRRTRQEIRADISEIYANAPYQGRHGLLVSDGSSQRYWELKAELDEAEKRATYKIPVKHIYPNGTYDLR